MDFRYLYAVVMGKSSVRTQNYREISSRRAEAVATFREQMTDFARGELLRQLREKRPGLSQEDAAHGIGTTSKSLRKWEKGGAIRWHNAVKLGTYYEIDPSSLVIHESIADEVPDLMGALSPEPPSWLADLQTQLAAINEKLERIVGDTKAGDAADDITEGVEDLLEIEPEGDQPDADSGSSADDEPEDPEAPAQGKQPGG